MYAANDEKYTLLVMDDPEPLNPRVDYDNLGRMVCWHSRYSLGDKHSFSDPEEFLRDLYRRGIRDNGKQLIAYLKSHKARGAFLEYNRSKREWDLYVRCYWRTVLGSSEPDWEVMRSAPKDQLNDSGWFIDDMLEALTIDDLKELLGEMTDIVILPLYLYDHSIQSISTASFYGRAHHAEWDSGQVGYIYADHEMLEREYGTLTKETVQKAETALIGEVEAYDCCLRGACYGFRLFENGEEIDSCWGFLGELDDIRDDLRSYLPDGIQALVDKLSWVYESEDEYLQQHTAV